MSAKNCKITTSAQAKKEEKKTPSKTLSIVDANYEKLEVENFKRLIAEKIKDPKMAKKAAMIIADMINKKGEK